MKFEMVIFKDGTNETVIHIDHTNVFNFRYNHLMRTDMINAMLDAMDEAELKEE